ncbi:MAG: DUF1847 domain-containing protein [Anaerovoracaceae bacterium]
MNESKNYACALCGAYCDQGDFEKIAENCQCNDEEVINEVKELYLNPQNYKLASKSALVEAEGYCKKTRLEEIMIFAEKCGFKKLGLAFCVGFMREAVILHKILKKNSFEIQSVVCKNGSIPKEYVGIKDNEKIDPGNFEPMCNPIGQAILLNECKTDFNIVLGLCVGHDSLFFKYSQAPVTVLAAKDRVLAHNPIGALYLSNSYYKDKLYNRK